MTSPTRFRVRLEARYLPILLGLILLLQLIIPHKSWMILLVGLGGAWLIGNRWAYSLARSLELTRERRFGWTQVGDNLQERFTLTNRGWATALWVTVRDHSTLPSYQASKVRTVGGRALIHWFTDGVCYRRGLFTLGPTTLETGDPFGFYRVTIDYPGLSTMMVMPPIVKLPAIDIASAARVGEGRPIAERTPDRSVSAAGVREFAQGDSLHRIHWPTSARRDDLFVRIFERTPASDWWIFLDLYQQVQAGVGQNASEEQAIVLAASLASQGLEGGTAVGLVASGLGQGAVWLPPKLGDDQRWRILRELALVEPGDQPLARQLAGASAALKGRSSLIIITADIEGQWLDPMLLLMRRGIIPTVLVLDRAAFGGQGDADGAIGSLLELGVTHHRVRPDLLERPEMQPGQIGKWRQTPRGHWEPRFDHEALDWRELT
ncbi:MAG: DUF58 domain-containing protein [Chloroflexota bacterium]|nr:MAG: DUF58 domain-containing protein [Chloroflexota bacterium]